MTIRTRNRFSLLFVTIFIVVVGVITYPQVVFFAPSLEKTLNDLRINLGLDLQGGIHLEYAIDLSSINDKDRATALDAVQDVVERRVNAFGVGEPIVQRVTAAGEERLIVELPGIKDIEVAKQLIKETPFLEFRESMEEDPDTQKFIVTLNETAQKKAQDILVRTRAGEDFAQLAKEFSQDPGSAQKGGDLGFAKNGTYVAEFNDVVFSPDLHEGEVYAKLVESQFGWHIIKKEQERLADAPAKESTEEGKNVDSEQLREVRARHILIAKKTIEDFPDLRWKSVGLTGQQLDRSDFDPGGNNKGISEPGILLYFNEEGKKIFADVTTRNVGKQFAIFLDGQVISAPVIRTPITDGVASITGHFTIKEAKALAARLNEGALPVPIMLVGQQSVDASLGAEAMHNGIRAGLIGLAVTMIYMIVYYRFFGFVAAVSLAVYAATLITLFKLSVLMPSGLSITLTLSGIAGFILSIGMAIDANILIFERIKEERRRGKTLKTAVAVGFERAWPSIRDGNFSTLITCVILIGFGTGFVQGFAIILFLGVIVSMFTAIVLVRFVLRAVSSEKLESMTWLIGK